MKVVVTVTIVVKIPIKKFASLHLSALSGVALY